ncbi:hypothetical protein HDU86_006280 [Geranomyces michiganensis]|nr:hypothetical protein HDU86_006280 [Geranomyces michiganensis]
MIVTSTAPDEFNTSATTDSALSILPHYHDDPHSHHSAPFVDPTTNAPSPILSPVLQVPATAPAAAYSKHALHTPAIIPGVTPSASSAETLCYLLKPLNDPPLVPHVRARRAAASYKRRKPQQYYPPAKPPFLLERSLVSAAALAASGTSFSRTGSGSGGLMQGTPFPAFLQQVTPRTHVTAGLAQLNPVSARFIDRVWWTGGGSEQSGSAPLDDRHHEDESESATVAAAAAAAALMVAGANNSMSQHSDSSQSNRTTPSEWEPDSHHDLHHHGPNLETQNTPSGAADQASIVNLPPATLAALPSDSRDLLGILLLAANGRNV